MSNQGKQKEAEFAEHQDVPEETKSVRQLVRKIQKLEADLETERVAHAEDRQELIRQLLEALAEKALLKTELEDVKRQLDVLRRKVDELPLDHTMSFSTLDCDHLGIASQEGEVVLGFRRDNETR